MARERKFPAMSMNEAFSPSYIFLVFLYMALFFHFFSLAKLCKTEKLISSGWIFVNAAHSHMEISLLLNCSQPVEVKTLKLL